VTTSEYPLLYVFSFCGPSLHQMLVVEVCIAFEFLLCWFTVITEYNAGYAGYLPCVLRT
jgi:hypothetical protein